MSDPKYVPRDYSSEPAGFGKVVGITWLAQSTAQERAYLAAAKMQHKYACRIRTSAKAARVPFKALAAEVGRSYDSLMKMLRGVAIMRLDDLTSIEVALGTGVTEFTSEGEWDAVRNNSIPTPAPEKPLSQLRMNVSSLYNADPADVEWI